MSGDAWKEGGIDATGKPSLFYYLVKLCCIQRHLIDFLLYDLYHIGALMVITLKVISCAINYNDGLLKDEDLRESQKKNRLIKLPSLIEYVGFCLCCGSHFAGPVYEIKDYLDWTEGTGVSTSKEKTKLLYCPCFHFIKTLPFLPILLQLSYSCNSFLTNLFFRFGQNLKRVHHHHLEQP